MEVMFSSRTDAASNAATASNVKSSHEDGFSLNGKSMFSIYSSAQ